MAVAEAMGGILAHKHINMQRAYMHLSSHVAF